MKNVRIPVPTMIDIDDIAHSLAMIGDTSVARHAIIEIDRQVAQPNFTYEVARQLMYDFIDELADTPKLRTTMLQQFNDDLTQYVAKQRIDELHR